MLSLYFTFFDLIAAAAFLTMWLDKKERFYLLSWAIAHALIPIILIVAIKLNNYSATAPGFGYITLIYALSMSGLIVSMVAAAMNFRGLPYHCPTLFLVCFTLASVLFTACSLLPFGNSSTIASLLMAASYLLSALLLWSTLLIEKITSLFFIVRILGIAGVYLIQHHFIHLSFADTVIAASAVSAIINAILLLLISFFKTSAEQSRNLRFLDVLHVITTRTRTEKDGHAMSEMTLTELLKLPFWDTGTVMKLSEDGLFLEWICSVNHSAQMNHALKSTPVALAGTLSEQVIRKNKAIVIGDKELSTLPLNSVLQGFISKGYVQHKLNFIVPITDKSKPIGVLVVADKGARVPYSNEMETLVSIGEILGASIENLSHIRDLDYKAFHDPLTGLKNRAALHNHCKNALRSKPFTLLLFDLDNFKQVNDMFGHKTGDELLKILSTRIHNKLDNRGDIFRLGGDEFVLVYPDDGCRKPQQLAKSLLEQVREPIVIAGLKFECLASIGVVETKTVSNDSHELLRCADLAMYKAKHSDQHIAYYDKAYDLKMRDHIQLLSDVSAGIENNEFELFYQPIINLKNNTCTLCEGLLRWNHPTRGLLSAAEFIPQIELTEQISFITSRVIELAVHDIADWRKCGINMHVAINLSARNFLNSNLGTLLIDTVRSYDVPPSALRLEITETLLMKDPSQAAEIINKLTSEGFKFSLDDFGTGYSSLAYLARFNIHSVKIDRSFVGNMTHDKANKNIVNATVDLVHKLGFLVVAEGVEDKETEQHLVHLGCDYVQGFLYSKPVNKADFEAWHQSFI